jgi:hypothetical protein
MWVEPSQADSPQGPEGQSHHVAVNPGLPSGFPRGTRRVVGLHADELPAVAAQDAAAGRGERDDTTRPVDPVVGVVRTEQLPGHPGTGAVAAVVGRDHRVEDAVRGEAPVPIVGVEQLLGHPGTGAVAAVVGRDHRVEDAVRGLVGLVGNGPVVIRHAHSFGGGG